MGKRLFDVYRLLFILYIGCIPSIEDLGHLLGQFLLDLPHLSTGKILLANLEEIVIQFKILNEHFGVEDILLIDIHIDHLVALLGFLGNKVLDGVDLMVDKDLSSLHISCEAPHPIINGHDI